MFIIYVKLQVYYEKHVLKWLTDTQTFKKLCNGFGHWIFNIHRCFILTWGASVERPGTPDECPGAPVECPGAPVECPGAAVGPAVGPGPNPGAPLT